MQRLVIAETRIDLDMEGFPGSIREQFDRRYQRFFGGAGDPDFLFRIHEGHPVSLDHLRSPIVRTSGGKLTVEGAELLGELDPVSGYVDVVADSYLSVLDKFLRTAVTLRVIERGGCLFHAAAVVVDGKAYLFPGPSGAGKTTLSSLARDPLSDEICAVMPYQDGWMVYATPWRNGRVTSAPLAGVYTLSWNGEEVIALPRTAALRHLTAHIALFLDEVQTRAAAFAATGRIAAAVPFGRLTFTKQTDVDDLIRRAGVRA